MANFFKKALGVFVEFEDKEEDKKEPKNESSHLPNLTNYTAPTTKTPEIQAEAEKFEKYFDDLFDKANLPGPDYFEFYKMMDTLEAHIPDEKARLSATFASLSIQGLTKEKLINTATQYKTLIENDQRNFEMAVNDKLKTDVGTKNTNIAELEAKIRANSELIQKLTKEITESQVQMEKQREEVKVMEDKLKKNKDGYQFACEAVITKINTDIVKIQTTL
jgi:uncharacterized coiled-coil protein SlyX